MIESSFWAESPFTTQDFYVEIWWQVFLQAVTKSPGYGIVGVDKYLYSDISWF